jgi:hypothetical protein
MNPEERVGHWPVLAWKASAQVRIWATEKSARGMIVFL